MKGKNKLIGKLWIEEWHIFGSNLFLISINSLGVSISSKLSCILSLSWWA